MFPRTSDPKARSWRAMVHQAVDAVLGGARPGEAADAALAPAPAARVPGHPGASATPMARTPAGPAPAPAPATQHPQPHPHRQPIGRRRPKRRPGTPAPRPSPASAQWATALQAPARPARARRRRRTDPPVAPPPIWEDGGGSGGRRGTSASSRSRRRDSRVRPAGRAARQPQATSHRTRGRAGRPKVRRERALIRAGEAGAQGCRCATPMAYCRRPRTAPLGPRTRGNPE
jgi:hypothetical protein